MSPLRALLASTLAAALACAPGSGAPPADPPAAAAAPAAAGGAFSLRRVAVDPAGGGDATLSPDGRRLVTTSRRAGNWDLWSFDIGTGTWTRLTDDETDDFEGRWSPDGRRLAFTSGRAGSLDVWVLELESGALRRLTDDGGEEEYPVWTPDGRHVIYTGGPWGARDYFRVPATGGPPERLSRRSGMSGACTVDPAGDSLLCHAYDSGTGSISRLWLDNGELTPLTAGDAWDYKPAVSPDGEWVAFSRSVEGPAGIALLPASGGRVRLLTDSPHDDRWPTWSADGRRLLFHRPVDRGTGIWLYDRTTGRSRRLVGEEEAPLQATLDAARRHLAYCAMDGARRRIVLYDLRSGERRPLDTGPGEACYPRWSPDGEWIAYAGKSGRRWEVSVVRPDGSGRRELTAGHGGLRGMDGPVDWSPDGGRLLFHADTAPFAADLYTVELATGRVASVTDDAWFDEAPSWSADGESVLFMSTRGGDWTWGLFELPLAGGEPTTLAGPDWEQKNFPRMAGRGNVVWSFYDDERRQRLAERSPDGRVRVLDGVEPGARWPSYTADGRSIAYTTVEHHVEYWLAENLFGAGSPLNDQLASAIRPPAAEAGRRASLRAEGPRRSPVDLLHR